MSSCRYFVPSLHYASSSKVPIFVRKTFTHHISVEKVLLPHPQKRIADITWCIGGNSTSCVSFRDPPHASLTVRDIAECFLASTTMQINVEMTRRHVHDNVFKGHKSQTRYVLTHALTEETFEALVRGVRARSARILKLVFTSRRHCQKYSNNNSLLSLIAYSLSI